MEKSFLNKFIKYFIIISFFVIGILYWFSIVAMHYIFGVISLILLLVLFIVSLIEKIKIPKKQIITFISSILTIISVIITHFIIGNNPFSYQYEKIDGDVKITGYRCKISNNYGDFHIEIPSHINGMKVKVIGEKAFYGSNHFYNLIIPNSVEIIEDKAFFSSNAKYITLPHSVKYIGEKPFVSPYTNYLTIPSSVDYVGAEAFFSVDIIAVETNTTIDNWAVNWCNSSRVYYDSVNVELHNGVVYILHNDKTSTVSSIYSYPQIEILGKIIYNNEDYIVTTIDSFAGYDDWFEEIIIPNTITKICSKAFGLNEKITKIFIPSSVKYMEESVFVGCENLVISVEHTEKPKGWSDDWNIENREVKWAASSNS